LSGVAGMEKIQAGILSVSEDEQRHATYLQEAMLRRYGYFGTESLVSKWRSRKVDALMAMVGGMIERRGEMRPLAQDRTDDAIATATEETIATPVAA